MVGTYLVDVDGESPSSTQIMNVAFYITNSKIQADRIKAAIECIIRTKYISKDSRCGELTYYYNSDLDLKFTRLKSNENEIAASFQI